MKKIFIYLFIFISFAFIGCASKPTDIPESTVENNQEIIKNKESVSEPSTESTPEVVEVPAKEEPTAETPTTEAPVPTPVEKKVSEEFVRSTSQLQQGEIITEDVFENDKNVLLNIIDQLSIIMANKDYDGWVRYLSQESILYWRNSSNLSEVSKRLPIKGLRLKTLEDYFKFVFIPSRLNKKVDEIRYVSSNFVKVVQMQESVNEYKDIIYYTFEKINGKWLLCLDKLD